MTDQEAIKKILLGYDGDLAYALKRLPLLERVAKAAKVCLYATLLHDWRPLEEAFAALENEG